MELSGYLAILRRWWWTLLVAVWVAGLLGYLFGSRIVPTYESSVRLLVGPINTDTNTLRASGQLVQTYAELAVSQPLLESTVSELGLPPEAADSLAAAVRTTANDQTRILTIRVQGRSPEATTQAANAIAGELIDLTSRGTSRPEGQVQVIEFAKVPFAPIAPQISLIVLMAAAAGLLGAVILVLLAEYFADRVQDAGELARITGERPLGVIPAGGPEPLVPPGDGARRVPLETFGSLVASLAFASRDSGRREVAVATADSGVHGSDLALGFAAAAAAWRPVLYIDASADGATTALLGVTPYRAGGEPLSRRVLPTRVDGLRILPAGTIDDFATISPTEARALIEAIAGANDVVVIDAGDLDAQPSAMVWAGVAGGAIVAVRRGSTRRSQLRDALARLERVRADLLGCVLVEARGSGSKSKTRRWSRTRSAAPADVPGSTSMARRQPSDPR